MLVTVSAVLSPDGTSISVNVQMHSENENPIIPAGFSAVLDSDSFTIGKVGDLNLNATIRIFDPREVPPGNPTEPSPTPIIGIDGASIDENAT